MPEIRTICDGVMFAPEFKKVERTIRGNRK